MSIRVDPTELVDQLRDFGAAPFLITTSTDGRPHTTHVVVTLVGVVLQATVGRKTAANVAERPLVSLLWPPNAPGGFSLIVDGQGVATTEGDDCFVAITATGAVLHRNAAPEGGYVADCQRLDGE